MARKKPTGKLLPVSADYGQLLSRISSLLEQGRRATVRTTNAILSATYWEVGRQIVEHEQGGQARAEYGEELMLRLAGDLTARFGRGFGKSNLFQMRTLYLGWQIFQTPSGKLQVRVSCPTVAEEVEDRSPGLADLQPLRPSQLPLDPSASLLDAFPPLSSYYVYLASLPDSEALRQEIVATKKALEMRGITRRT